MARNDCPECGEECGIRAKLLDHVRDEHGVLTPEELAGGAA